jgi:5-(carboxyamino)imidazole ribonucleotide synthase
MVNLLGEEGYTGKAAYEGMEEALALGGVYIHLYGKKTTKPYRKMGHITIMDTHLQGLKDKVQQVKSLVKVVSR